MWRGKPLAAINIHYILSALTMEQVVDRYLEDMRAAARKIEEMLALRAQPALADDVGPRLRSEPD